MIRNSVLSSLLCMAGVLVIAAPIHADSCIKIVQAVNHKGKPLSVSSPEGIGATYSSAGVVTVVDMGAHEVIGQLVTGLAVKAVLVSIDGSAVFVSGERVIDGDEVVTIAQRWNARLMTLEAEGQIFPLPAGEMQLSEEAGWLLFTSGSTNCVTDLDFHVLDTEVIPGTTSTPTLDGFRHQVLVATTGADWVWHPSPGRSDRQVFSNYGVSKYFSTPDGVQSFGGSGHTEMIYIGFGSYAYRTYYEWTLWNPSPGSPVAGGSFTALASATSQVYTQYFADGKLSRNGDYVYAGGMIRVADGAQISGAYGDFVRDGSPYIASPGSATVVTRSLESGQDEVHAVLPGHYVEGFVPVDNSLIFAQDYGWPEIIRLKEPESVHGFYQSKGLEYPIESFLSCNRQSSILKQSTRRRLYFWNTQNGELLGYQNYTFDVYDPPDDGWTTDGKEFLTRLDYYYPPKVQVYSTNKLLNSNVVPTRTITLETPYALLRGFVPTTAGGPIIAIDAHWNLVSYDSVTGEELHSVPMADLPGSPVVQETGGLSIIPLSGTYQFLLHVSRSYQGPSWLIRGSIIDFQNFASISTSEGYMSAALTRDESALLVMDDEFQVARLIDTKTWSDMDVFEYPLGFQGRGSKSSQQFFDDPFLFIDTAEVPSIDGKMGVVCRIDSHPLRLRYVEPALVGAGSTSRYSDANGDEVIDVCELIGDAAR